MSDRPGEMDERDVDERFASIVAAWDGPVPTGPASAVSTTPAPAADETGTEDDDTAAAPDAAATPDDDTGPETPSSTETAREDHRPPWVNPSPLDLVVPASSWRVAPPPASGGTTTPPGSTTATPGPEDEDHYEPPPVTLPPQEDLHFWGAVIGLVGGPLLLLYVALARPFHSERWFAAGVVLSLVGFALLVLRQPRHRDPSDDDDGARV